MPLLPPRSHRIRKRRTPFIINTSCEASRSTPRTFYASRSHRHKPRPNDLGGENADREPTGYAPRLLRKGLDASPERGIYARKPPRLGGQYETRKKEASSRPRVFEAKTDAKTGGKSTNQAGRLGQAGMRRREISCFCCPLLAAAHLISSGDPLTPPYRARNALHGFWPRVYSSHPADPGPSSDMRTR